MASGWTADACGSGSTYPGSGGAARSARGRRAAVVAPTVAPSARSSAARPARRPARPWPSSLRLRPTADRAFAGGDELIAEARARPAPSRNPGGATLAVAVAAATLLGATAFVMFGVSGGKVQASAPISEQVDQLMIMAGLGVDEIRLSGHRYTIDNDVFAALALQEPTSLLRYNSDAARRRVEALSWVSRATVTRVLPNTVEVHISERTPIAVWLHDTARNSGRCGRPPARPRRPFDTAGPAADCRCRSAGSCGHAGRRAGIVSRHCATRHGLNTRRPAPLVARHRQREPHPPPGGRRNGGARPSHTDCDNDRRTDADGGNHRSADRRADHGRAAPRRCDLVGGAGSGGAAQISFGFVGGVHEHHRPQYGQPTAAAPSARAGHRCPGRRHQQGRVPDRDRRRARTHAASGDRPSAQPRHQGRHGDRSGRRRAVGEGRGRTGRAHGRRHHGAGQSRGFVRTAEVAAVRRAGADRNRVCRRCRRRARARRRRSPTQRAAGARSCSSTPRPGTSTAPRASPIRAAWRGTISPPISWP